MRRDLLKNKIGVVSLILVGALSVLIDWDVTWFLFTLAIGIPIFFSKEDIFGEYREESGELREDGYDDAA